MPAWIALAALLPHYLFQQGQNSQRATCDQKNLDGEYGLLTQVGALTSVQIVPLRLWCGFWRHYAVLLAPIAREGSGSGT